MPIYGKIIVIKRDGKDGSIFPVTKKRTLIGKDETSDIRIQLPNVSASHCAIVVNAYNEVMNAFMENLSHAHPTSLNGQPLRANALGILLKHGDIFTIGDRSFKYAVYARKSSQFRAMPKNSRLDSEAGAVPKVQFSTPQPTINRDKATGMAEIPKTAHKLGSILIPKCPKIQITQTTPASSIKKSPGYENTSASCSFKRKLYTPSSNVQNHSGYNAVGVPHIVVHGSASVSRNDQPVAALQRTFRGANSNVTPRSGVPLANSSSKLNRYTKDKPPSCFVAKTLHLNRTQALRPDKAVHKIVPQKAASARKPAPVLCGSVKRKLRRSSAFFQGLQEGSTSKIPVYIFKGISKSCLPHKLPETRSNLALFGKSVKSPFTPSIENVQVETQAKELATMSHGVTKNLADDLECAVLFPEINLHLEESLMESSNSFISVSKTVHDILDGIGDRLSFEISREVQKSVKSKLQDIEQAIVGNVEPQQSLDEVPSSVTSLSEIRPSPSMMHHRPPETRQTPSYNFTPEAQKLVKDWSENLQNSVLKKLFASGDHHMRSGHGSNTVPRMDNNGCAEVSPSGSLVLRTRESINDVDSTSRSTKSMKSTSNKSQELSFKTAPRKTRSSQQTSPVFSSVHKRKSLRSSAPFKGSTCGDSKRCSLSESQPNLIAIGKIVKSPFSHNSENRKIGVKDEQSDILPDMETKVVSDQFECPVLLPETEAQVVMERFVEPSAELSNSFLSVRKTVHNVFDSIGERLCAEIRREVHKSIENKLQNVGAIVGNIGQQRSPKEFADVDAVPILSPPVSCRKPQAHCKTPVREVSEVHESSLDWSENLQDSILKRLFLLNDVCLVNKVQEQAKPVTLEVEPIPEITVTSLPMTKSPSNEKRTRKKYARKASNSDKSHGTPPFNLRPRTRHNTRNQSNLIPCVVLSGLESKKLTKRGRKSLKDDSDVRKLPYRKQTKIGVSMVKKSLTPTGRTPIRAKSQIISPAAGNIKVQTKRAQKKGSNSFQEDSKANSDVQGFKHDPSTLVQLPVPESSFISLNRSNVRTTVVSKQRQSVRRTPKTTSVVQHREVRSRKRVIAPSVKDQSKVRKKLTTEKSVSTKDLLDSTSNAAISPSATSAKRGRKLAKTSTRSVIVKSTRNSATAQPAAESSVGPRRRRGTIIAKTKVSRSNVQQVLTEQLSVPSRKTSRNTLGVSVKAKRPGHKAVPLKASDEQKSLDVVVKTDKDVGERRSTKRTPHPRKTCQRSKILKSTINEKRITRSAVSK